MKVRLKLTRNQYRGFAVMAQNCCNAVNGEHFNAVQYRDVLRNLVLRMAAKVPQLKAHGNKLTLDEAESLVMVTMVGDLVPQFGPFEMGLGYWFLGEADLQRQHHVSLIRANLQQQNQLR